MERMVEGTTERDQGATTRRERPGLWKRLTSDEGPQFDVPRPVRWLVWWTLTLIGMVPLGTVANLVPLSWEPTLLEQLSVAFVATVYGAGWIGGIDKLVKRLFGPPPERP